MSGVGAFDDPAVLHHGDPQVYLADVITRIVQAHPNRGIDELMPWRFKTPEASLAAVA